MSKKNRWRVGERGRKERTGKRGI